jgi:hypothetical protein
MIHGDGQGVSLSSRRQPDAQLNHRWSLNMTHAQQDQPRTPIRLREPARRLRKSIETVKVTEPKAANSCDSIYLWWKANGVNPDRSGAEPHGQLDADTV